MADSAVVHIGENSPEYVAWIITRHIMAVEGRGSDRQDRKYILDTYAECLGAVKGYRGGT